MATSIKGPMCSKRAACRRQRVSKRHGQAGPAVAPEDGGPAASASGSGAAAQPAKWAHTSGVQHCVLNVAQSLDWLLAECYMVSAPISTGLQPWPRRTTHPASICGAAAGFSPSLGCACRTQVMSSGSQPRREMPHLAACCWAALCPPPLPAKVHFAARTLLVIAYKPSKTACSHKCLQCAW